MLAVPDDIPCNYDLCRTVDPNAEQESSFSEIVAGISEIPNFDLFWPQNVKLMAALGKKTWNC